MHDAFNGGTPGDQVIGQIYDTIAEPSKLEDFLVAWESYVDETLERASSPEADGLTDIQLHTSFTRGMSIFNRMGRTNSASPNLQSLVDSTSGISLVTDGNARVLAMNRAASEAIQQDIAHGAKAFDGWISDRIASWRQGHEGEAADYLFSRYLSDKGNIQRNFLTVLAGNPEHARDPDETYYLTSSVDLTIDENTASAIQAGFKLSRAETEIALRIMNGDPPAKIAEMRGVSLHTVRFQVRSLLAKTESQGVSDLVRLLCSYAVKHASVTTNLNFRKLSRLDANPAIESSFDLEDGRTMHYRDMGDAKGTPVLFFHSIICGTELTEHAVETCRRAGFRIIAPALPGYWKSSPNTGVRKKQLLKSNAADCAALLKNLNIDRVLVMGHIVGSASAQAFAIHYPDMAKSVLMLGHAGHFNPAFFKNMGSVHRAFGKTILYAPRALAFIVRAAIALIDSDDEEKLLKATHNPTDFDKLTLKRPDIKDVVIRGIREGVAQGGDAFAQYSEVSMMDWLHQAAQLTCPVTIMQAVRDELITDGYFSPYLKAKPETRFVQVKDAGKYLLYSHWPEVLAELERLRVNLPTQKS